MTGELRTCMIREAIDKLSEAGVDINDLKLTIGPADFSKATEQLSEAPGRFVVDVETDPTCPDGKAFLSSREDSTDKPMGPYTMRWVDG